MESVIIGTEVKFAVSIKAQGFDMAEDNFTLSIMKGRNVVKEYSKSDLVVDDDTYLLCVDTEGINRQPFRLTIKLDYEKRRTCYSSV